MPRFIKDSVYACSYCGKQDHLAMADACEKSHKLIYVPIPKDDLLRLIQFIYTGDIKLLREEFVKRLINYARTRETSPDMSSVSERD